LMRWRAPSIRPYPVSSMMPLLSLYSCMCGGTPLSAKVSGYSGLTENACHVIIHIVDPLVMSQMESDDVASIICQALPGTRRRLRFGRGRMTRTCGAGCRCCEASCRRLHPGPNDRSLLSLNVRKFNIFRSASGEDSKTPHVADELGGHEFQGQQRWQKS
jgi:hypothetical protein